MTNTSLRGAKRRGNLENDTGYVIYGVGLAVPDVKGQRLAAKKGLESGVWSLESVVCFIERIK